MCNMKALNSSGSKVIAKISYSKVCQISKSMSQGKNLLRLSIVYNFCTQNLYKSHIGPSYGPPVVKLTKWLKYNKRLQVKRTHNFESIFNFKTVCRLYVCLRVLHPRHCVQHAK